MELQLSKDAINKAIMAFEPDLFRLHPVASVITGLVYNRGIALVEIEERHESVNRGY